MSDNESPPPPTNGIQDGCEFDRFSLLWSYMTFFIVPDDTIRIMLATDNHIGYMERDPIRGQDSINTFKEILQLAVKYEVCSSTQVDHG